MHAAGWFFFVPPLRAAKREQGQKERTLMVSLIGEVELTSKVLTSLGLRELGVLLVVKI